MKRTLISWLAIVLVIGLVAVLGCTQGSGTTPASQPTNGSPANGGGTTHEVGARDFAYNPAQLTISVGDTITWTNRGTVPHTVTEGSWNSGYLTTGDGYSWTFHKAGTYEYGCDYHTGMLGTIIVK